MDLDKINCLNLESEHINNLVRLIYGEERWANTGLVERTLQKIRLIVFLMYGFIRKNCTLDQFLFQVTPPIICLKPIISEENGLVISLGPANKSGYSVPFHLYNIPYFVIYLDTNEDSETDSSEDDSEFSSENSNGGSRENSNKNFQ
ncbi:hypothetical protein GWI33_000927 [Rhynchophorus ferrugineus]|uniref:Uncharacterized protein n=1 Tax=Rhynchophorus ferrugineus TaxID=354439 RepID=A0A834HNF0_RHYFE|nr:hypothetical protein GWI33_000927 [Rhynchophorus ferrugineus]